MHRGEIDIRCREVTENDKKFCVITVHDNGPGIPADIIDVLFEPGFSTKYDETTGDINRGLGLTLVRDLLTDKFHGEIAVESTVAATGQVRKGTTFTLRIPAEQFCVDPVGETDS